MMHILHKVHNILLFAVSQKRHTILSSSTIINYHLFTGTCEHDNMSSSCGNLFFNNYLVGWVDMHEHRAFSIFHSFKAVFIGTTHEMMVALTRWIYKMMTMTDGQ